MCLAGSSERQVPHRIGHKVPKVFVSIRKLYWVDLSMPALRGDVTSFFFFNAYKLVGLLNSITGLRVNKLIYKMGQFLKFYGKQRYKMC